MKITGILILFLLLVLLPSSDINAQKKKDPPKKKTDQPTTKAPTRYPKTDQPTTKPPAGYPKTDVPYKNKNYSPEMVFVQGGTFQMGSGDGESDEKPVHSVTVGSFLIGIHEVTQELWESVMGSNPSNFKGSNRPVEQVSWFDVVEFCNKLSEREGLQKVYSGSGRNIDCDFNLNGYRLPTEAEWDYAARGGIECKNYIWSGGNEINLVAWHSNNSWGETHEVGKKQPNELGLYDMSGNVWEWCWDWYGNYTSSNQINPEGPSFGSLRVLRGGSWSVDAERCHLAYRYSSGRDSRDNTIGFRLARTR